MSTAIQHMHHPFHKTSQDALDGKASKNEANPKSSGGHRIDYVALIGRIAAVLSVIMYVSYITQIANNLGGHPGSPWQPLAAFFNCVFWAAYGFLKTKKDIPIIVANVPGIFLALTTFITSFIH